MSLANLQRGLRDAVIDGDEAIVKELRARPGDPRDRLAIHRRHYHASLVTALLGRFPATAWLVGSAVLIDAARAFVRRHPPAVPCIAEYGAVFPAFLRETRAAGHVPYLAEFAELDWHLGRIAVDIDVPGLPLDALATIAGERVSDSVVHLQPGLHYLAATWPIDDLVTLFVTDTAPAELGLSPADVYLELRGARGSFRFARLVPPDFMFRDALKAGRPLGSAAEQTLVAYPDFDAGQALIRLFADGLVTSIAVPSVRRISE